MRSLVSPAFGAGRPVGVTQGEGVRQLSSFLGGAGAAVPGARPDGSSAAQLLSPRPAKDPRKEDPRNEDP